MDFKRNASMKEETFLIFLSKVREGVSINFPAIARQIGSNWFKEIKPELAKDANKRMSLEEVIEEIRYTLLQEALEVARLGKGDDGRTPELSYINAVIKQIDSGTLLNLSGPIAPIESADPELEKKHLSRLGVSNAK